jgi:hypothetical protein
VQGGGPDLASKAQILAYYELVLAELVGTGRVTWLPLCEHRGQGTIVSLAQQGRQIQVTVRRKTVDATRCETHVPATLAPNYGVAEGVNLVPVNGLARIKQAWERWGQSLPPVGRPRYVVIGAGKTGIDALLHLLDIGVEQEAITWIVSNDCWYHSR